MIAVYRITASLLIGCIAILELFPLEVFAADLANGQKLYMANCAGCHGENGISIMEEAPNLARFDMMNQPDQTIIDKIQTGGGSMPPYIGILSDSEILDLVNYLRTLN